MIEWILISTIMLWSISLAVAVHFRWRIHQMTADAADTRLLVQELLKAHQEGVDHLRACNRELDEQIQGLFDPIEARDLTGSFHFPNTDSEIPPA